MRNLRHRHAGALLITRPDDAEAQRLDAADPLAHFAAEFHHPVGPDGPLTYMAGHSLGLQPRKVSQFVTQELEAWARLGVLGHHEGPRAWIGYHELVTATLARLAGAQPGEVVAMNSLTVNLHLMMVSFFRPTATRNLILIERSAFPSDRYAVISQLHFHGLSEAQLVEIGPREGERTLRAEDLREAIARHAPRLALVLLPGVQYLTGQVLDIRAISAQAHDAGALVGWDLAHAIGNIALHLHDDEADFAVWCSYKYLNAGPGAIGGCFVHQRHGERHDLPRLAGWWGHDKQARFLFAHDFVPIPGAEGWQLSNPPILATAPLLASLELFEAAGMEALREKSALLSGTLRRLIETHLAGEVEILTPRAAGQHGCQLSLRLLRDAESAKRAQRALTAAGLVGDWREPDVLRLAPIPLYNTYADVYAAVGAMAETLAA